MHIISACYSETWRNRVGCLLLKEGAAMAIDLATFLTAVYTVIDDLYRQHLAAHKPARRGAHPDLSDSEVLPLLVGAHWLRRSERDLLRYAAANWQAYFPRLLHQSAF